MKLLALLLATVIPINSYATPDIIKVKSFVDSYIIYLKIDDIDSLKKLSVSKGTCQYKGAKRIIRSVGDNKYTVEVKPFSKKSKDYKFALYLSDGSPVIIGDPSHAVYIKWDYYKKENYTAGHKCHSITPASSSMMLVISNNNEIKEHSYCKEQVEEKPDPEIKVAKVQFNEIKKHLYSKEQFSSYKTKQYIMKKYGLKYIEAHKTLKVVCDGL